MQHLKHVSRTVVGAALAGVGWWLPSTFLVLEVNRPTFVLLFSWTRKGERCDVLLEEECEYRSRT